jgi:hypothetical protein
MASQSGLCVLALHAQSPLPRVPPAEPLVLQDSAFLTILTDHGLLETLRPLGLEEIDVV